MGQEPGPRAGVFQQGFGKGIVPLHVFQLHLLGDDLGVFAGGGIQGLFQFGELFSVGPEHEAMAAIGNPVFDFGPALVEIVAPVTDDEGG